MGSSAESSRSTFTMLRQFFLLVSFFTTSLLLGGCAVGGETSAESPAGKRRSEYIETLLPLARNYKDTLDQSKYAEVNQQNAENVLEEFENFHHKLHDARLRAFLCFEDWDVFM